MEKPGDIIRVFTTSEAVEGILMPNAGEFLVIKLSSGYNLGIDRKKITKIELVQKYFPETSKPKEVAQENGLPTISILHTGGTIASKVDYQTGGVIARYSPDELLGMFPELSDIANIKSRLISNMWSEDMNFAHYNALAEEIRAEIKDGTDGIIVTHGTDTLHYTSAALNFMLQNLPVPVLLVGSQRSSDRGSSDAGLNLLSAAYFISKQKDFADVAVCMHGGIDDEWCLILPGTKNRKMHSSRRDAFRAVNVLPYARVNFHENKIQFLDKTYRKPMKDALRIANFRKNIKIGLYKAHPNMYAAELEAFKGYDGLILEGYGIAGNFPVNKIDENTKENDLIAAAISNLSKSGTIVAATTQTIYGSVNLNVYQTGRKMQDLGIIGNYTDMTPETAYIKLAWLLSNYPKDQVPVLYVKNIVGENSSRLEFSE